MARRDLWPEVEPLLSRVERPARYLNHEWGCAAPVAEDDFAFCMIYPDTYELGQANQAVRILVNAVNAVDGMGAERAFLPAVDMADLMREKGMELTWDESVIDYLVKKSYSLTYGARNLRRTIQKDIEDAMAAVIVDGKRGAVRAIKLSSDGEKVIVEAE